MRRRPLLLASFCLAPRPPLPAGEESVPPKEDNIHCSPYDHKAKRICPKQ